MIDRFFENDLSEQELKSFQLKLKEDPKFAQAFALEKDVMEGIESLGNDHLRIDLQQMHQEEIGLRKTPPVKQLKARRPWLIAAALFFALALAAWWLWTPKTIDSQQLYAQYAQHQFAFVEKSSSTDSDKKLLFDAETQLNNGQYKSALPLLDQYLKSQPKDAEILLAKGIALLELKKDTPQARQIFQSLINSNSLLVNDGKWYLALLELQQNQLVACRQLLQDIPSNSSRYSKAQNLLQDLPAR